MENNMLVPKKVKNRTIISFSNSASWYTSKKIENGVSKRHMHTFIQSSTVHMQIGTRKLSALDDI